MYLTIDGDSQHFVPLQQFRDTHDLPAEFSVSYFEPKQFEGLATIDSAGADLKQLKQRMLDAIPDKIEFMQLLSLFDDLQVTFRRELEAINDSIHLKPAEIDFAVAGFGDANQTFFYELMRHRQNLQVIDYKALYWQWVADSTRVSMKLHTYAHESQIWQVQIVNNVYGRVGLKAIQGDTVTYVADSVYTCPAQGYMIPLAHAVMEKIIARLVLS